MKRNLTMTGSIELEEQDLVEATKEYLLANEDKLLIFIKEYLRKKENVLVKKLERNGNRVVAIIEGFIDEGVRRISTSEAVTKPSKTRDNDGGHRKPFVGFYDSVIDIVETQRKRKKDFISWDDLREELLSIADSKGHPKFEYKGVPIEMSRIKQYLTPSQLARQKNLKGIKFDKRNGGLSF